MPTQFIKKLNKTETGFHLLMTLVMADGNIQRSEMNVVLQFLEKNFEEPIDLIKEQAFFRALPEEERMHHFTESAAHFYSISNESDRHKLTEFAMKVVMADKEMEATENKYIHLLYDAWGIE